MLTVVKGPEETRLNLEVDIRLTSGVQIREPPDQRGTKGEPLAERGTNSGAACRAEYKFGRRSPSGLQVRGPPSQRHTNSDAVRPAGYKRGAVRPTGYKMEAARCAGYKFSRFLDVDGELGIEGTRGNPLKPRR